ncbi:exonuclease SbcCD subunit D [Caproiciproducens sp. MSJ-32]|uniref:exonuclease SbcCD subunit D n=1 Tax=Caproiciproducens sp. MSJ-32 TaxID=2841527 RepID=UPI001C0FAD04|nr:exonuclease SbcCD subunit D [Caproiciproducens sp. MSJ-32]MBU5453930.1 exonuclease SbcCD subunit D [Caproiciproducens sp. MSJ-32]
MKIFHMGDWHIGKLVNGFYMTEDQEYILEELFKAIDEEKPDVLVIAGDLYDRSIPPVQAVELLNKTFEKIVIDLKTPVIAIAGNHDSNERLDFGSSLLRRSGLYIIGNLKRNIEKIVLEDEFGKVNFYPIPFADLPIVRDLYEDENIRTPNDAMKKIIDEINKDIEEKERNVAIAHGYVTKIRDGNFEELIESDSEKPISIGGTDFIDVKLFEKFNYTALGHLHGPQKVGNENIRYSGSLMKYSFSEVNQKKGINIVNLDSEGNIDVSFYKLIPKRDFRIIEGYLDDIINNSINDNLSKEDYIKIILKDKGEILDPMAKLRTVYPNVMELIREEKLNKQGSERKIADIKEKSTITLFKDFYRDIVGEECSSEELEIITNVMDKAKEEED